MSEIKDSFCGLRTNSLIKRYGRQTFPKQTQVISCYSFQLIVSRLQEMFSESGESYLISLSETYPPLREKLNASQKILFDLEYIRSHQGDSGPRRR